MTKLRLEITKGEEIRYISHLDYARTIERALRRTKMPLAYSEGFNPHMKLSFASALSVGVTSMAEYMEVELTDQVSTEQLRMALAQQLPPSIVINRVKEVVGKQAALMAVVNIAAYRIVVPWQTVEAPEAAKIALEKFNNSPAVLYIKENPKGRREIDIKNYIAEAVISNPTPEGINLTMLIKITPTGSVKPSEVLKVLTEDFALPVNSKSALIIRLGLYVETDGVRVSPLEMR
ncbi:MAG: hypothetical protein H6Q74_455 [Firmicutes bacterium]|nr:hypothetical protein [Bacillota bacterium]